MIIPNESFIEGIGSFKETKKIVRLKKGGPAVVKELKKFSFPFPLFYFLYSLYIFRDIKIFLHR
jgi:hypothetical protein